MTDKQIREAIKALPLPPQAGDPYFNTRVNGGYSPAISGKNSTTGKPAPGLTVAPNCVGMTFGIVNKLAFLLGLQPEKEMPILQPVNAERWVEIAKKQGLPIEQTPKIGAVMCWQKGATLNGSDGAGHVCIVTEVVGGSSVKTFESGYNSPNTWYRMTRQKGNGNWGQGNAYKFLGFIYPPYIEQQTGRVLRKGDSGDDVLHLQGVLAGLGYYGGELDGKYGKQTMSAVCGFQLDERMEIDGICGPKTRAALSL